ncbi:MAG: hypothetical protein DRP27_03735 [Thermotogae bacterium]|nr:TatD family hydrolase [Thermotogota bacterium]RKX45586.1 MAG: hypothetical protein DRP27_03735 [Thermotogota bacterium]
MKLVDTHVHLCSSRFNADREKILEKIEKTLEFVIEVSYNRNTSLCSRKLADLFPFVYFSVGIHPHDAESDLDEAFFEIANELVNHPKCVAVGEIGLDFYRDLSPRDVQEYAFLRQLEFAAERGKAVIIHVREAYDRTIELLRGFGARLRGVVHSFSGDLRHAEAFLQMGLDIGISGPITYPKNSRLREVVARTPLDHIQVETDSPYLPPQRYRGKRNDPTKVLHVATEIARVKGIELEAAANTLVANARRLFAV